MVIAPLAGSESLPSERIDLTPHIGTQFPSPNVQLSAILASPNSDKLLNELAHLIAERGVVFFKAQDITPPHMKQLANKLGVAVGKPETSTAHRHPVAESSAEFGDEITVISSKMNIAVANRQGTRASRGWHSDISFEPVPADYTMLKLHSIPPTGGDTLWGSGYEAYDRLSPAMKAFLEPLTALHDGNFFLNHAKGHNLPILTPRGSPENVETDYLAAVHPVIRTHPVTGYKTLFVNGTFTKRILELNGDESEAILLYLSRHIAENHNFQVRYKWDVNDIAIWDNRCTYHSATFDYTGFRAGDRAVGIGEKPYFDPKSKSRREVLGIKDPFETE